MDGMPTPADGNTHPFQGMGFLKGGIYDHSSMRLLFTVMRRINRGLDSQLTISIFRIQKIFMHLRNVIRIYDTKTQNVNDCLRVS